MLYDYGGSYQFYLDYTEMTVSDISEYSNVWDVPLLFFAILTVDVCVLFLTRYFPGIFGAPLNKWYTNFGLSAVLSDVLVILIGFLIARYIYTIWIKPAMGWNPEAFVGLLVVVQLIHDVLFYLGVILPLPKGHNEMIDVFKSYAQGGGAKILAGDAGLMIASAGVAFAFKAIPMHATVAISTVVSYALTYILYTPPKY